MDRYSNSFILRVLKEYDKSVLMQISQVFGTNVDSQKQVSELVSFGNILAMTMIIAKKVFKI